MDVDTRLDDWGSAINITAYIGHWDIAYLPLDRNVDIHPDTGAHGTPLHATATVGRNNIVQIVLRNGADIEAADGLIESTAS
jgi:hypothetical protein